MMTRRLASTLAFVSLFTLSGVGVNLRGASIHSIAAIAQTAPCDTSFHPEVFTRRVGSTTGINLRSDRRLDARTNENVAYNSMVEFEGWAYGQSVNDLWTGKPDALWYRLKNRPERWVPSAYMVGYPNSKPPIQPANCNNNSQAEAFFKWAIGQRDIARLDRNDLKGECVSLIARYMAEVFFPANQKNQTVYLDHGRGVAAAVARNYSQYFSPLTTQGLPKRGAVISFPTIGPVCPDGKICGHVAIVMAAQQLSNGQRQVKIMDSNGTQGRVVKEQTEWINIPDGRAQGYGTGIVWTNPK